MSEHELLDLMPELACASAATFASAGCRPWRQSVPTVKPSGRGD